MKAASQLLQDDRTSHCWSYGSINHPSSQSRKISIGVMVDSTPKKISESSKEGDIAGDDGTRVNSTVRNSSNAKGVSEIEERTATTKSPWVATKSFQQRGNTSESIILPQGNSDLPATMRTELDGAKNAGLTRSVSLLANDSPVLPSDDDNRNKFSGVTYERKKKKHPTTERMQDFTFTTAKDVPKPDTQMKNEKLLNATENGTTVSLRLRLQEILGAGSSPKDHSPTPELGSPVLNPDEMGNTVIKPAQSLDKRACDSEHKANALFKSRQSSEKRKQKVNQMGDTLFKPRQNSDTIETDSDSPDQRVERPVTRSLTRRRAPTKKTATTKSGQSSGVKLKHHAKAKNIASLEEDAVGGTLTLLTKKKNERKSSRVEPHNLFKENDVKEKIQKVTHWSVSPLPPAPKTSALGTRHSHSHTSDKERDYELKKDVPYNVPPAQDRDYQHRDLDSPENKNPQEDFVTSSVRNLADQEDGFHSPTFRFKTPVSSSTLSPILKTDEFGEIHGFRSPQTKKQDCYGDGQMESCDDDDDDDADKTKISLTGKASSSMKHAQASVSEDLGSSDEESPTCDQYDRCTESEMKFRETSTAKRLKFMVRPAIRSRNKEINVGLSHTKTSSPYIKGRRESNWIPTTTQHNEVDVVTRALELVALELQKLKSKIKSATMKKSSEILMSVAEDVHQQLQNAETHIQTDMGKLKNLSNLKQKRVETRFEEQQERLQSILAKFKEQINQHLQDCESTFEAVEADHKEFKVTLEKTKTSHRKLVLQVEECIEILLVDAQKKIAATHEVARKKMQQLKQVLAVCLKDDIDMLG